MSTPVGLAISGRRLISPPAALRWRLRMLLFTNDDMRSLLANSLKTATLGQSDWRDLGQGPGVHRKELYQLADIHRQCEERR